MTLPSEKAAQETCSDKQWENVFLTTLEMFPVAVFSLHCAAGVVITLYNHFAYGITRGVRSGRWWLQVFGSLEFFERALSRPPLVFSTVCHFSVAHFETYYSSLVTFRETDRERGLTRTSSKTHLGSLITSKLCLISGGSHILVQHVEQERRTSRGSGMSVFVYDCTWLHAGSAAHRSCLKQAL